MAVVNFRLKTQTMRLRLRRELIGAGKGRREAVRVMGRTILENLIALSPVDTRRYRRGWQQAGREAGAYEGKIDQLRPSSYHKSGVAQMEIWVQRLEERYENAKKALEDFYPHGPPKRPKGSAYQRMERAVSKSHERLIAAREDLKNLRDDPYAVVFGAGKVVGGGKRLGVGRVTIRQKVYGGTGRIYDRATASVIHLRNMEPHATILEWKRGVLRTATAAARGAGLLPVKKAYMGAVRGAARK